MPNKPSGVTKEILLGVAEMGKILFVGESPQFDIKNWRMQTAWDFTKYEQGKRRKFSQALWRLKKNRLIITNQKADGTFIVELTEKGRRKVKEFRFANLEIPIPKRWDGKWRIVIFDIPNKRNAGRAALRDKLKELDFYQLQKSVWAFPYPCEKEIEFIVELFHLYPYVQIIEANKIKNDAKLKKYYRLF